MTSQERDIIAELQLYAKSSLPATALKSWVASLTPEERGMAFDYITKRVSEAAAVFGSLMEIFESAGLSFGEAVVAGLEARAKESDGLRNCRSR